MAFTKSLRQRLSGRYKYNERVVAPRVAKEIKRAIESGCISSDGFRSYFNKWLIHLKNMESYGRASLFCGGKTALRILSLSKDQLYPDRPTRAGYFMECFAESKSILEFDGIRLPLPKNTGDEILYVVLFEEVIIPYLFKQTMPNLTDFFCDSPYEYGPVTLMKGDTVFDVGANVGFFSAYAGNRDCNVYAFEPASYTLQYLESTCAMNPGITICPYALSDHIGELQFVTQKSNIGASRQESLIQPQVTEEDCIVESVQVTTIDDFVSKNNIKSVDFIKADIEGAERDMLSGAKITLRDFRPKLSICTYHLPDDPEVLTDIIMDAQPEYKIIHKNKKLYASA